MTHLTPHEAPGPVPRRPSSTPTRSALYYLTNDGGEFTRVRRYDLATGKHEDVESADWDIPFTRFSHNGKYRVTAINEDGRTVHPGPRHRRPGELVPMPKLPEGDVTSVVFSRDEAPDGRHAERRPLADEPLRLPGSAAGRRRG